ncbi:MAG: cation:proton antiporter [Planctomycetaceae bacterium]|nr:cation:proton antiporter [Planctomycetaceae bacterium]
MSDWETFLLGTLGRLCAMIIAARVGGWCFRRLGQPQVVGEILAGLILGPSVAGRFLPAAFSIAPTPDQTLVFRVLSELGLMLLMLEVGLEFDFQHLRQAAGAAFSVAVSGIVLPFALGFGLALWLHPRVAASVDPTSFALILAVAMAITAIPILGRIMMELGLQRTRMGAMTISAAAIDDAVGWILLAGVTSGVRGHFQVLAVCQMAAMLILFVTVMRLLVAPLAIRILNRQLAENQGTLTVAGISIVLVLMLLSAMATSWIGVFSLLGPFILGACLSRDQQIRSAVGQRFHEIVHALLLPVFFTSTGLKTNVGLLATAEDWILCLLVLLCASAGKIVGCGVAALWSGLSRRESLCIGIMMNTRALMGLVAVNVGRELDLIPDNVFCMLVLMAILTTVVTTPVLRRLSRDLQSGDKGLENCRPQADSGQNSRF